MTVARALRERQSYVMRRPKRLTNSASLGKRLPGLITTGCNIFAERFEDLAILMMGHL
jgi:hypothetical protein